MKREDLRALHDRTTQNARDIMVAEARAVAQKTARLRELRLSHETPASSRPRTKRRTPK